MFLNFTIKNCPEFIAKRFIEKYGIDPYKEACPCGKGNYYKFCCKNKPSAINNENELKSWQAKIDKDIWGQTDLAQPICCYNGCTQPSIGSHTVQESRYLNMIENADKPVLRYTYMFKKGRRVPYLKMEPKNKATTFYGFCNPHDTSIFSIIEGYNPIVFNKEQNYALVYRSLSYMYNKLFRLKNFQIKEHFANQPAIYGNSVFKKSMLYMQVDFINSFRALEKQINNLRDYMNILEQSYNPVNKNWNIVNDVLCFSEIRRIPISKPSFVFQTTRVMRDRENEKYHTLSLDYLELEKDNYLTTISLPDANTNEQIVLFAAKKVANKKLIGDFFKLIANATEAELRNIVNNIMLEAYEEFYFSRDYHDNLLSISEQEHLRKNVNEQCALDSDVLDLSNITATSKMDLFK